MITHIVKTPTVFQKTQVKNLILAFHREGSSFKFARNQMLQSSPYFVRFC